MAKLTTARIPIDQIQQGPYQHSREAFEGERMDYIRRVQRVFSEVHPGTVEEWVDGFRRDMTPDREIALWSVLADVFEQVIGSRETTPQWRKCLYVLLLQSTFHPPEEVARDWPDDTVLTRQEAAMILSKLPGGGRVSGSYGIGLPTPPEA